MYDISSLCCTPEIPQGLRPSPRGERITGTRIWGKSGVGEAEELAEAPTHPCGPENPGIQRGQTGASVRGKPQGRRGTKSCIPHPRMKETRRAAALPCAPWEWCLSFQPQGNLGTCHQSHPEPSEVVMEQGPAVSSPRQGLPGLFSSCRCHRKPHWSFQMRQL